MKKFFTFGILAIGIFLIAPATSHAQISSLTQDFDISLDPLMPAPGDTVKVFVSSNVYDLDSYSITWKIDDKIVGADLGLTSIQTEAPRDRSKSHYVTALIQTGGKVVEKSLYVQGRSVMILEQSPDTTVFPGYRGRKVPAREEDLKLVAIPDESFSDLVSFVWDKNYVDGLPELSGTKRNYFIIPGSIFTDIETVGLSLEDLRTRRRVKAYKDLNFATQNMEFYDFTDQDNPNFYKAIPASIALDTQKILTSILAFPFGYNKSFLKKPEITWSINNEEISTYTNKLVIPLKNDTKDSSGSVDLVVEMNPSGSYSQQTQKAITVSY